MQFREFLKRERFTEEYFAHHFRLSKRKARRIVQQLVEGGYLKHEHGGFEITIKGRKIRNATAKRRLSRKTADRLVHDIMARVPGIEANRDLLYDVAFILVFGSYVDPSKQTLGDIDIVATLTPRETNAEKHQEQVLARRQELRKTYKPKAGLRWRERLNEVMSLSENEIFEPLLYGGRRTHPYISSHTWEEAVKLGAKCRLLYLNPKVSLPDQVKCLLVG